jgi:hypothetical protein
MWAQQHYTLRAGRGNSNLANEGFVSFATARGLRSAAAHYLAWDLQVSDPEAPFDTLHRPLADAGALPTVLPTSLYYYIIHPYLFPRRAPGLELGTWARAWHLGWALGLECGSWA